TAPVTGPYFDGGSIQESRYVLSDPTQLGRPFGEPAFTVAASYTVGDHVAVAVRTAVRRRELQLPYGEELRELMVVPPLAVNVTPRTAIIPLASPDRHLEVSVELINNLVVGAGSRSSGTLTLRLPRGWTSSPTSVPFTFSRAGEKVLSRFTVAPSSVEAREYRVDAIAALNGHEY